MFGSKKKSTFTKASTPVGIQKQRAAIIDYYSKQRSERNKAKLGKTGKR